ncbi:hypothetical protein LTR17_020240 [Elasticomyces elasticus]|nr:hypothetical protein LTR17_020240 [Elasticomyces elasticus]
MPPKRKTPVSTAPAKPSLRRRTTTVHQQPSVEDSPEEDEKTTTPPASKTAKAPASKRKKMESDDDFDETEKSTRTTRSKAAPKAKTAPASKRRKIEPEDGEFEEDEAEEDEAEDGKTEDEMLEDEEEAAPKTRGSRKRVENYDDGMYESAVGLMVSEPKKSQRAKKRDRKQGKVFPGDLMGFMRELKLLELDKRTVEPLLNPERANLSALFDALPESAKKVWTVQRYVRARKGLVVGSVRVVTTSRGASKQIRLDRAKSKKSESWEIPADGLDFEDLAVVDQISEMLENFMNRWSGPLSPFGPLSKAIKMRVTAALVGALQGTMELTSPWFNGKEMYLSITYYDPESGTMKTRQLNHEAPCVASRAPSPPAHIRWTRGGTSGASGKTTVGSAVSNETAKAKPEWLEEEKYLRFLKWKLHGVIGTKSQVDRLIRHYERLYRVQAGKGGSVRVGIAKSIVRMSQSYVYCNTQLVPSASTLRELGLDSVSRTTQAHNLVVRVHEIDGEWITPVLQAGYTAYVESGDVTQALIATATVADFMNGQIKAGFAPPGECSCTSVTQNEVHHHCSRCFMLVLCSKRQPNAYGSMLCENCLKLDDDTSNLSENRVKAGLTRSIRQECRRLGIPVDEKDIQDAVDDAVAQLPQGQGKERKFIDKYTGVEHTIVGWLTPFGLSVDAVDPFARMPDGTLRNHVAGNVLVTTSRINFAKGRRNLPGVLEEVKVHFLASETSGGDRLDGNQKVDLDKQTLGLCEPLHIIACKQHMQTGIRLNVALTSEEVKATEDEWRSGKLSVDGDHTAWTEYASRIVRDIEEMECPWDDETLKAQAKICLQIEKKFGYSFQKSPEDQAPWISLEPMPEDWNMDKWFTFCYTRLQRLKLLCNRYWETLDTEEGIAAELMWQMATDEEAYLEFLNLPRSMKMRHALMMSLGKKIHGQQMLTGWPAHPRELSDRDDSKNNLLGETNFSNTFKGNLQKEGCLQGREYIGKINVPKEKYDRDLPPPSGKPITANLKEVEAAYDAQGFEPMTQKGQEADKNDLMAHFNAVADAEDEEDEAAEKAGESAAGVDQGTEKEGRGAGGGGGGDGDGEVRTFKEKAAGCRAEVLKDFPDLLVTDGRIVKLLGRQQELAEGQEVDKKEWEGVMDSLGNIFRGVMAARAGAQSRNGGEVNLRGDSLGGAGEHDGGYQGGGVDEDDENDGFDPYDVAKAHERSLADRSGIPPNARMHEEIAELEEKVEADAGLRSMPGLRVAVEALKPYADAGDLDGYGQKRAECLNKWNV